MINVVAAIMVHEGKIFLARRAAGQRLEFQWEFPGGKLEEGESPEQALKREMAEEFGVTISVGKRYHQLIHEDENGIIQLTAYWASWEGGVPRLTVHDEMAWVAPDKLITDEFAPADRPIVERLKKDAFKDWGF